MANKTEKFLLIPDYSKYEINCEGVVRNAKTKEVCKDISEKTKKIFIYRDDKKRMLISRSDLLSRVTFEKGEAPKKIVVKQGKVVKAPKPEKPIQPDAVLVGTFYVSAKRHTNIMTEINAHQYAGKMQFFIANPAKYGEKNERIRELLKLGIDYKLIMVSCQVQYGRIYNLKDELAGIKRSKKGAEQA